MNDFVTKLLKKNKNIAGLDIGVSTVKFVEFSGNSLNDLKLANYAVEKIPQELMTNSGGVENIDAIAEIVRKCWKKSGSKTKDVCIAINENITKKMILPKYDFEEDLKVQVENEMEKLLPGDLKIDDLAVDFYNLGENVKNPTDNDILIVGAKKEKIDEKVAIVEAAGLVPVILDTENDAIQNMVRFMEGEEFLEKTYMLLDGSSHYLRLLVFKNGELIYTKESSMGSFNFTQDLMNNLEIDFDEAEKMKKYHQNDERYELVEKNFLNNYMSELMSAISYFSSATSIYEVDKIILTGGVSCISNIEHVLKEHLLENNEIIVRNDPIVGRPLENIGKSNKINLSSFVKDEPLLFLAISLGLRKYLRNY
jgi:type IV pilus assembly protein PilM